MHRILGFLRRFEARINSGDFCFVHRKKNLDGLARLGITIELAKSIISSLTERDYVEGPSTDHDGSEGEIWTFGKTFGSDEIYIKLKLEHGKAKVISFHKSESPLRYPFHDEGGDL